MSQSPSDGIEILIPTLDVRKLAKMAPRLTTLDGKVIGLLSNSKQHGDEILRMVVVNLKEKYRIKDVILERKLYIGNAAPPELLDKLAGACDAAITGVGD